MIWCEVIVPWNFLCCVRRASTSTVKETEIEGSILISFSSTIIGVSVLGTKVFNTVQREISQVYKKNIGKVLNHLVIKIKIKKSDG